MDDFELFWREADRRYAAKGSRVRIGEVTNAVSVLSYSVQFPGESTDRSGVPSVVAVAPQVGQLVRVELVGDDPVIVDVLGGPAMQSGTASFTLAGGAGTFPSGTVAAADTGTVTFAVPYAAAPVIKLTVQIGGNLDAVPNVTSRSATNFGWRVFARDPGTSWNGGAGTLHWVATGT